MDNKYPPYKLSEQDLLSYHENGYLIVSDLFSEDICEELKKSAHSFAEGNIHNYLNFHRDLPEFEKIILHEHIHDICDQLQDERMIPIGSIFFFGMPNNPLENGSLPHQDNYAARAPEGSYFVAALAIDDCDSGNGALSVYPGSHKLGELPYTQSKNFEFDENGKLVKVYPIGSPVKVPEGLKPITLEYKKGSVIFMHTNTIHFADKNIHPTRWRHKFYMHFIKDGHPFWPGWNARRQIMDRGPRRV